jgi:hypothetical protein
MDFKAGAIYLSCITTTAALKQLNKINHSNTAMQN